MKHSRPACLALVGLLLWVTACTSYSVIPVGSVAEHGKVRVTLTDGSRVTLHQPWVEADSIKGVDKEIVGGLGPQRSSYLSPTAYALDQVAGVESVGTDEVGTVFTVLGILALATAVFFVVACSGENSGCFSMM